MCVCVSVSMFVYMYTDTYIQAACEYAPVERADSEGFTASQRKHLNRLIHASKVYVCMYVCIYVCMYICEVWESPICPGV